MTNIRDTARAVALAALVVLSVVGGTVAFAGSAGAAASKLSLVSDQPFDGTGTGTVSVEASSGATVSFKIQDSSGRISGTKTVTDGGAEDQAPLDGVIETTLDLDTLFETPPESGTAVIYAGTGEGFSIPQQGYTSKVQVAIDSDAPTAIVESSGSARAGHEVTVGYTATDVPQKVRSITMKVLGSDGGVYKTVTGLQPGENSGAQFTIPSTMSAGTYDVKLIVVDEVGHKTTDTLADGLVVESSSDGGGGAAVSVGALEVLSSQPVAGTGKVSITVATEETVSLKVQDASGTISATKTVTDGSSEDRAETSHVVVTTLDLGTLFESKPASGTALIYAGKGDGFSVAKQTYEDKRQVALDADAPTASLAHGATGEPGQGVKVGYDATDVPQKISSARLEVVGPDGGVYTEVTGLSVGTGRTAQFTIPSTMDSGKYDLRLVVVDEVGHKTTDTLHDGLVVEPDSGSTTPLSALTIESATPVAGSGTVTVSATTSTGAKASFRVEDAAGTVSATKTVTDGGTGDQAPSDGVVRTTLDLGTLFGSSPESGTGIIYAGSGDRLSVAKQTFDDKQQVTIDADAPTATVTNGISAEPGQQVKIEYTVTDVPQKVSSITIDVVGSDGLVYDRITRLQSGKGSTAEFIVPSYMPAGEYDIRLTAVDEVGHKTTDTLANGYEVKSGGGGETTAVTVSSLDVRSQQPVKGTGEVVVRSDVSEVGAKVSFKIRDSSGTVSATKTVTDGGSGDQAAGRAAVVQTTLDLGELYASTPASGEAIVYAGDGTGFSIDRQTYDVKRQVLVDADAPTAAVTSGGSAEPGRQVQVGYDATDVPQKVSSVRLAVVGPDGTVHKTVTDLQAGEGRTAQFVVPWDLSPGEYDLRLVVVDEVGHETTDTLADGLVVTERTA